MNRLDRGARNALLLDAMLSFTGFIVIGFGVHSNRILFVPGTLLVASGFILGVSIARRSRNLQEKRQN
jgi:hypothetical protein